MTADGEVRAIEQAIKKELNDDTDLNIGSIENPAECATVLCARMDTVCSMMNWQATVVAAAEKEVEEKK